MPKLYKIEISSKTIIFTVFFIIFLNLLWMVRELIFSFVIAFIIMSALNPLVSYLERKRIPRSLSAVVIFIVLISGMVYLITWIVPPIAHETNLLLKNLPGYVTDVNTLFNVQIKPDFLSDYAPNITKNAFGFIRGFFSNVIFTISTIFFSFYFLIEENVMKKFFVKIFDKDQAEEASRIFEKVEKRMRAWLWGELLLMVVIGTMTFIGLSLIGARYVLTLAVIAGFLEIVPILGPILSAVPAFIVASADSSFLGLAVIALYFVIQQLENQIVVPVVMRRAVGINPIVTLAALIIGGKVGGVAGILLAIPITLVIETVLVETAKMKKPAKLEQI